MTSDPTRTKKKLQSNLKSRNGCKQCKRRKVKCDELPGSCSACVRRGERCSLKPITPPPSPFQSDLVPVSGLLDLTILHNYSTKTVLFMTDNKELQHFYRNDFITEVLKHDYLLHCILAFSAFHLVEQNEELLKAATYERRPEYQRKLDEYLSAGHTHYNAAIRSFRRSLAAITPQNCHALFVCSSYLFVTSVAESAHSLRWNNARDPTLTPSNSVFRLLKWLPLLRGAKAVALEGGTWGQIQVGPMATMFRLKDFQGMSCKERWDGNLLYLEKLSTTFREHSEGTVGSVCIAAIDCLRRLMEAKYGEPETSAAFIWAIEVDPAFMNLLESETSEALLVFASYCSLLHSQSWRWWIKDWPANLIRAIEPMVSEQWKGMLEWPLRTIEYNFAGNRLESPRATLQHTNTEENSGEYRSETQHVLSHCTNTPGSEVRS